MNGADPYEVDGLPRVVVKSWVGQALGSSKATFTRWSSEAKERYARECPGRELRLDFKAREVADVVLQRHPILKELEDLGFDSVSLMYHEAEVLSSAMKRLRLQGVASLPIHDGLIVAGGDAETAKIAMAVSFADHVQAERKGELTATPSFKVDKALSMGEDDDG
jgi:hypothetical protein